MTSRERIVVGGDTTPSATAALRWAVGEAARNPQCSVLVVHAFDVEGRADLALERDLDRSRRDARYRTQSWVVEVLAELEPAVSVLVQTPDASIEDALVDASRNATMVVIGEPHNGHRRDLAERLSERCTCPVVTVGVGQTPALAG
ncbi:MAG TPA: universal stress protein [Nocardioidaceae bacterium]|jgi:nucleotide-binding universal stress UspA family protein|nr:universal stress protein [Nocardioidaceae bacterium]